MANLAFSVMEFKDAYKASGNYDVALRAIKWGTDWLLKGHVSASDDPSQNAFVGQVGVCAVRFAITELDNPNSGVFAFSSALYMTTPDPQYQQI